MFALAPRRSLEGEMLPDALKCTKMTVFGPELSPELDWNRSHTEDSAEPIQLDLRGRASYAGDPVPDARIDASFSLSLLFKFSLTE
jgi:hypothetical protein